MKYFTDGKRHLVCMPYSKENLFKMSEDLGIDKCWFHSSKFLHFDIPKNRIKEIENKCILVSSKDIVRICKGIYEIHLEL